MVAAAHRRGPKSEAEDRREELPVNDVFYVGLGMGVLALMALYAYACERL